MDDSGVPGARLPAEMRLLEKPLEVPELKLDVDRVFVRDKSALEDFLREKMPMALAEAGTRESGAVESGAWRGRRDVLVGWTGRVGTTSRKKGEGRGAWGGWRGGRKAAKRERGRLTGEK